MIRKAIGVIVEQDNEYMLVHKINLMDTKNKPKKMQGHWDFCKGVVKQKNKLVLKNNKLLCF
ncbi:hypothetical protein [Senegalia massiliensis]|uniref:Uncharacterized protein n=1 Tax=Senegalia massiliensis TaxID=1720316 RepID=A0A845QTN2_9CLOT|nr:hypothetical protein [Senegalia massiliensis]NBI05581.1 hypothetical protein [Senegalia massiliensis]